MIPVEIINAQFQAAAVPQDASLAAPTASLLARLIESRLHAENAPTVRGRLPRGVSRDLRPSLPRIGMAALMLYTNRQAVESFPLIYTTLALAHPN